MREVPGSIPGTAPFLFFFASFPPSFLVHLSLESFLLYLMVHFHGLVVRIPACHAGGPGSIPGGSEFASSEQFLILHSFFTETVLRAFALSSVFYFLVLKKNGFLVKKKEFFAETK